MPPTPAGPLPIWTLKSAFNHDRRPGRHHDRRDDQDQAKTIGMACGKPLPMSCRRLAVMQTLQ